MMSLASLANVPSVEDRASFDLFSFSNMDQHRNVIEAVSARGVSLPVYPLDPLPPTAFGDWLRMHQQSHNDINGVLGVDGVDLTSVDFNDQGQAAEWVRLHLSEHMQWAQLLQLS